MVFRKLLRRFRGEKKDEDYANRFVKFYHLNKKRLNKERRGSYKSKKKSGVCIRCSKKTVEDTVFCAYHRKQKQEYNRKMREQRKKQAKKS